MENEQHFKPSADMRNGTIALFILVFIILLIFVIIGLTLESLSDRLTFILFSLFPFFVGVFTLYMTFPFNEIFINDEKIVSKKYFSSITIAWDEVIKIYEQIMTPPFSLVSDTILVIIPLKGIKKVIISNTINEYERLKELILDKSKVNTFDHKAGKMRIHEWTRKNNWSLN